MADNKYTFKDFLGDAVGPVLGGVIGIGTSAFNNMLSNNAAEQEHQWQIEQWNRENRYNHPVNQRARLQAAGFNPAAVVGEVASSNNAGGLSSVPSHGVAHSGAFNLSSLVDSLKAIGEIEKMSTDTDFTTSQIALKAIEIVAGNLGLQGKELENFMAEIRSKRYPEIIDSEIRKNEAQAEQAHEAAVTDRESRFATIENLLSQATRNVAAANYDEARTDSERALLDVEIAYREAQTDAARQQANLYAANVLSTQAEIAIMDIESQIKNMDLNAYQQRFLWEKELNNQHIRINKLAIAKGASEAEIAKLDSEYQAAMQALNVDENGEATGYAIFKDFMDAAGSAVGIAVGAALGSGGRVAASAIANRVPKRNPIGYR